MRPDRRLRPPFVATIALALAVLAACCGPDPASRHPSGPVSSSSALLPPTPSSASVPSVPESTSASPPVGPGDAGALFDAGSPDTGPAAEGDDARQRPTVPDEPLFGIGEALEPSLAASSRDWIVGWTDSEGAERVAYATTERRAQRKLAPIRLSAGAGSNVSVAATQAAALAAWLEPGPPAAVWVGAIDESGALRGRRRISSGADPAGPPAVMAHERELVVAWPQGLRVEAVRLSEQAAVLARTSWLAGVLRPPGPINRQVGGEESRLGPEPEAPSLAIRGGKAVVHWRGGAWLSDDVHRLGTYEYAPRWAGPEETPLSPLVMPFGRAPELLAVAGDRALLAITSGERPTPGAAWGLAAVRLGEDAQASAHPITSEPIGPLRVTLLEMKSGFVAAWPSPSRNGVAVCTIGADAVPGEVRVIRSLATDVGQTVALAAGGGPARTRVAYLDRVAGRSVVRLAWLADAVPSRVSTPVVGKAVPALAGQAFDSVTAAPLGNGRRWLMAWKGDSYESIFALWLTDGLPSGAVVDLLDQKDRPRSGEMGSAAPAGDAVLLAYQRCDDQYHCVGPRADVAVLRPPASKTTVTLAAGTDYLHPRIATRPTENALHVGVAMSKGEHVQAVVARLVAVPTADAAPRALASAPDIDVGLEGWAISAAWLDDTLVTAVLQDSPAPTTITLVGVRAGSIIRGVRLEAGESWGAHRLLAVPDGVVLVGTQHQGMSSDLVLYWISRDLRQVTRKTVIARGAETVYGPAGTVAGGEIGLGWYEHGTESVYAARVSLTGTLLSRPRRLEGPPSQVGDDVVLIPVPNGLRAFWSADDGVHTEALTSR